MWGLRSTYALTTHFRQLVRSIVSPHGLTGLEIQRRAPIWYSPYDTLLLLVKVSNWAREGGKEVVLTAYNE